MIGSCLRVLSCAGAVLALLPAQIADGQAETADPARPAFADRIVASYDFEEPDNPFEVPADFFRAQSDPSRGIDRPGYPVFNRPIFDQTHARSGGQSVRLPIVRGSVSLRMRPGAVPIFADADYAVTVHARSEGLEHARFRLVVRLLDDQGEPIEGASWSSEPVMPGPAWQPVRVTTRGGVHAEAAFLQADAEVVQPVEYRAPQLGEHQVWPEDFSGSVWIDDLAVTQLPRILLRPATDSGVFVAPGSPALSLLVRDLTGERLVATLTTRDHTGRVVDRQSRPIRSSSEPTAWSPAVGRFGWYRTEAMLESGGSLVTRTSCDFIVAGGPASESDAEGGYGAPDRGRFTLAADSWDPSLLGVVEQVGARTRTHGLALGLWSESLEPGSLRGLNSALGEVYRSTAHAWARPTLTLPVVPAKLRGARPIERTQILPVLRLDHEEWAPFLESSLERLGEVVRRWRVGALGTAPASFDELSETLRLIRQEFSVLVPGPVIDLAWLPGLSFDLLGGSTDLGAVTVHFEAGDGSALVRDAVERWAVSERADRIGMTLAFASSEHGAFAHHGASRELVQRIIEAEAARMRTGGWPRIGYELVEPWSVSPRDGFLRPHPTLAAWRATIDRLQGRRVVADLGFIPGVRVYLLTPIDPESEAGGALVAWNESAPKGEAVVELNLGDDPVTLVDMWGNRSEAIEPLTAEVGQGRAIEFHRIEVGRDPVFVEGIDVNLALFTASVRLADPVLQAVPGPHERMLTLTNPWTVAIDGNAIILEPTERLSNGRRTGWDITPRVRRFSVGPGETVEIPLSIEFSAVEPSGTKPFVVDLALSAGPVLDRVRALSTLEIVLDGIELDARIVEDDSGTDAALEAVVTNTTGEAVDLTIHASARGYPRQSASIVQLPNGASVVRRFMYPAGVTRLRGETIFVGVEDPLRRGRLNRTVDY